MSRAGSKSFIVSVNNDRNGRLAQSDVACHSLVTSDQGMATNTLGYLRSKG